MTAYDLASRYIGIKEIGGDTHHPLILWWHSLTTYAAENDETPWCSAFVNGIAWELNLPRSKSAAARSWLNVGTVVSPPSSAVCGWDVVILASKPFAWVRDPAKPGEFAKDSHGNRIPAGDNPPDASVLDAPGHVGFFSAYEGPKVWVLGGNQSNGVTLAPFDGSRLLGIRRLLK